MPASSPCAGLHVAEVAVGRVDGGLDAGLLLGQRRVLVVDGWDLLRVARLSSATCSRFGLDGGLFLSRAATMMPRWAARPVPCQALDPRSMRCSSNRPSISSRVASMEPHFRSLFSPDNNRRKPQILGQWKITQLDADGGAPASPVLGLIDERHRLGGTPARASASTFTAAKGSSLIVAELDDGHARRQLQRGIKGTSSRQTTASTRPRRAPAQLPPSP